MKRNNVSGLIIAAVFLLGAHSSAVYGQVPPYLSYQGVLALPDGETGVPDGAYNIMFRIYTASEGGSPIWQETQSINIEKHIVNAMIGAINPLSALAFDQPYYLGVSVDGGPELTPRQQITPSAYSFFSKSVADGAITEAKLASNAVTTEKIQDGAVTQEKLAEGIEIPLTGQAGGDLTGTYPDPTVAQIRGWNVATTAPSSGQVLKWSGSSWAPQAEEGLTLPFSGTSSGGTSFQVTNTATTGFTYGGYFESAGTDGRGVFVRASATTGATYGGQFENSSTGGTGVYGRASATTGTTYGGRFDSASASGRGVYGTATASTGFTYGLEGLSFSTGGSGVHGFATAATGATRGVVGQASSSDPNAYGVYYLGGLAGSGGKSFQIDHPFDPANKYLNHYCTEGAEPLNAYSGNVVMDARGEAVVELPHYFESINRDYRYQLTCIGGYSPVYIAEEITSNRFRVAGGTAGLKVSWRVEAVRNDLYMQQRGAPVELQKPAEHRGTYLHPEFYGLPAELGTYHRPEMPDDPRPDL